MSEFIQNKIGANITPVITVAMPVYNAGKYLRLAVLSIVTQTFTDWEFIIIDDGSTDNALQSIEDIRDGRIRILQDGKNKGLAVRLNECIEMARGKYFARMDQDDVSYPNRLLRQFQLLEKSPLLDLIAVRAITIDERNKATGLFPSALTHEQISAKPWMGFYLPHPTWMGKLEWFRKYRYAVPGPYFCEDQELLLRSYPDSRFGTIDEILFAYRVRGKVNQNKLSKTRWTLLNIQLRYFSNLNLLGFVLLAIAAFFVKRGSDFLSNMQRVVVQHNSTILKDEITVAWNHVLSDLDSGITLS